VVKIEFPKISEFDPNKVDWAKLEAEAKRKARKVWKKTEEAHKRASKSTLRFE